MRGKWPWLLLLLPWPASAALLLAWEFERAYTPPPLGFDLEVVGPLTSGAPHPPPRLVQVAPSAPGACAFLPDDVTDTFCVELACPGAGIFQVTAYGRWDTPPLRSPPSPVVTLEVVVAPVCAAVRVELPPDRPPTGPPPTPCASAAYQPQALPMPTTAPLPAPVQVTTGPAVPGTTPVSPPPPRLPARVRSGPPPARVVQVTPKAVQTTSASAPVASATVYAGPPTVVALAPPPAPPALPPCR